MLLSNLYFFSVSLNNFLDHIYKHTLSLIHIYHAQPFKDKLEVANALQMKCKIFKVREDAQNFLNFQSLNPSNKNPWKSRSARCRGLHFET